MLYPLPFTVSFPFEPLFSAHFHAIGFSSSGNFASYGHRPTFHLCQPYATPPSELTASRPLVSWDRDRMRVYGYEKTANELALEADIPSDSQPPINAKQGLLFKWRSVFWALFAAKSSGQASDDALLYTQHQAQQAAQQQNQTRIPQPLVTRFPNGVPRQGPTPQQAPTPNGAGPAHVQPANPMPNGAGPSTQPQLMANQRLAMPQQQRPPNGAPFSSPTMAHSPQTAGTVPGTQPPHPTGMAGGGIPSQPLTQMHRTGTLHE
ncbi:hypothetical protein NLI96_g11005 [Meripilus lineatus]|uniref:Uncharacterized protein n=1 Tax=Meripilus lineatus TaxID=2056292 RepID=A0AAD5Y9J7_9APHY|nr:hypothetical protein NLI96_g11005 [Physisporinus lineatus]